MKKQLLGALCAASLIAMGCDNPKVKSEAEKAKEHLEEAGHETMEAGKALGRAAEAAGEEVKEKVEAGTETPPADTK